MRANAFSTLIDGNAFIILSSLSTTRSFISVMQEKNLVVMLFPLNALIMLASVLGIGFSEQTILHATSGLGHFFTNDSRRYGAFACIRRD